MLLVWVLQVGLPTTTSYELYYSYFDLYIQRMYSSTTVRTLRSPFEPHNPEDLSVCVLSTEPAFVVTVRRRCTVISLCVGVWEKMCHR